MVNERLDQFIRGVVGPGAGTFVPLFEEKPNPLTIRHWQFAIRPDKRRVVFEQSLINRSELFHIESGIIDPDSLPCIGVLAETECAKTVQNNAIIERALIE